LDFLRFFEFSSRLLDFWVFFDFWIVFGFSSILLDANCVLWKSANLAIFDVKWAKKNQNSASKKIFEISKERSFSARKMRSICVIIMDKIRNFCGFCWSELVEKFQNVWIHSGEIFEETLEKSSNIHKNTSLNIFSSHLEKFEEFELIPR